MELQFDVRREDNQTLVVVRGEIDIATSDELRDRLITLIDDGANELVVDLAGVDFLDSSGLGAFVECLKHARDDGGNLRIRGGQSSVRRVFAVTGLDEVFQMDGDEPSNRR